MSINPRLLLVILHDMVATATAVLASFYIRFEDVGLAERFHPLLIIIPPFVVYASIVYRLFHLYQSKWRFASLPDLWNIFRAATVLSVSLLVLDYVLVASYFYGTFFFGKITIVLYWLLQIFFLGGTRLAYRLFKDTRQRKRAQGPESIPTLVLGRAADAEVLLRAIESGAVRKVWPVGILSPSRADQGQSLRGVLVRGYPDDLTAVLSNLEAQGIRVARLVLTPSALDPELHPETLLMQARRLGLTTSRLPSLEGSEEALRLAPVEIEDLLLRPSVKIDYGKLDSFVRNKSIVVTGGGGSIGGEICERIVAFGAARLLIIENSEPAMHAILESLVIKSGSTKIEGRLSDVRDRDRILRLIGDFAPDIVFHAAALKHVPILERDWPEAVKTNIFGSVNVADAAVAKGATMVMISTDKAIEPVSMLGATKRFSEMYCQALDAGLAHGDSGRRAAKRLISVRFGNVLASNGSVVPKFKAQIEAGGPVTVTHPEMVRYFMTIREACDLVITAATHALGPNASDTAVYVLNMGQPVKIIDLAERLIRLSGLEPGRDVEIVFSGIRPGERLNEILFAAEEPTTEIGIPGIVAAVPAAPSLFAMKNWLRGLEKGVADENQSSVDAILKEAVGHIRRKIESASAVQPAEIAVSNQNAVRNSA